MKLVERFYLFAFPDNYFFELKDFGNYLGKILVIIIRRDPAANRSLRYPSLSCGLETSVTMVSLSFQIGDRLMNSHGYSTDVSTPNANGPLWCHCLMGEVSY